MKYSGPFTLLTVLFLSCSLSAAQAQNEIDNKPAASWQHINLTNPDAGSHPTLEQIVEKLTMRAQRLGCHSDDCALLVMNFLTTSGAAVTQDLKLADQFATLFANTLPKGRVVDRSTLQEFLARERISQKSISEAGVSRWLGKELGATIVLLGNIDLSSSTPQALFTIIEVEPEKQTDGFGTELPALAVSPGDLRALEPFGRVELPKTTRSGAAVYQSGVAGVSWPSCTYMPNPSYTDAARQLNVSGTILVDAIVTPEGTVESPQVTKGLPGGLNAAAIKVMQTWRCKPALKDNQPVATSVQFESNFRLF